MLPSYSPDFFSCHFFSKTNKTKNINVSLGLPKDSDSSDDFLIYRSQYVLSYNYTRSVANWVSWGLNAKWYGKAGRYNGRFLTDNSLPTDFYRVSHSDYTGSGYDRGHLVRSEERTKNAKDYKIHLEPNFSSIVVVVFLGSLLLTVMLGFYNYKQKSTNQRIKEILFNSVVIFLKGGISAYVILLLMFRMKDLSLPINISINDFYGGVVLGLFTYKLSNWIYKLLTEKAK